MSATANEDVRRAHAWLSREDYEPHAAYVESLASQFAAVRVPLEARIAELESSEAFRQALVSQLRLGQPAAENLSPEGTLRTILWKDVFGPGSILQFVDGSPQQQSGAMVYYLTVGPMLPEVEGGFGPYEDNQGFALNPPGPAALDRACF